jgi:hypothetical protein
LSNPDPIILHIRPYDHLRKQNSPPERRLTIAEWRDHGLDIHGQVADPGFRDAPYGDFSLLEDSPLKTNGFRVTDWTGAGPRYNTGAGLFNSSITI